MHFVPDIELKEASRRYGERVALHAVSVAIAPGSRVALIGPSGSGKTTLLHLIMGALRPTSGAVLIGGTDMQAMPGAALRAHRRRCGLVDQGHLLTPQLTVHSNVIMGMLPMWPWYRVLISLVWPLERERARALLTGVGLAERQWDRADTLSGGQKQRVAIARALAGQPSIVLADEPTAALDPTTASEVLALLMTVVADRGATLILSTHRVSHVLGHVDRVIGLRAGRVALDARPADVTDSDLDQLYEGSRERA